MSVPSQFFMVLIVSAKLFRWLSFWGVRGIHPPFGFSVYISEWRGFLTASERDVCVVWFSVWLLFVRVLFPKMTGNFPAQMRLFFKRITFSGFAGRDVHLLKCKLEFLEKKYQILLLICIVAICCYFSESGSSLSD